MIVLMNDFDAMVFLGVFISDGAGIVDEENLEILVGLRDNGVETLG